MLGIVGAWLTGEAMRSLLFRVAPLNPGIIAGATIVIAIASVAASLLPSHRAARISPMQAIADQ